MKERWSGCVRKRASDLHLLVIILLAPSPLIAPSDITHSRPHFDYRWESMGGGRKVIQGKDAKGTTDLSHAERKETGSRKIPSAPKVLCHQREIPVSHNLGRFPSRFSHRSYDNNVVIAELIAKIWQPRRIAKQASDWGGNASSQMIRQVVNKLLGQPKLFRGEDEKNNSKIMTISVLQPNKVL